QGLIRGPGPVREPSGARRRAHPQQAIGVEGPVPADALSLGHAGTVRPGGRQGSGQAPRSVLAVLAELPFWQLTAGFLAAMLVLVGVGAYIRYTRPVMLVVLGFIIAIPTLGWAGYAVVPGPVPEPGGLLWLAFVPAIAGVAVGAWMLAFMAARRSALTFETIELLSNGTLFVYGALVLALSDVLALWQPAFA